MELSKAGRFFPNECHVCKSTETLIRCECNMISYCGEEHQELHWPIHINFCNAIMSLLKERKISHIYQELHKLNDSDFNKKASLIIQETAKKLKRPLSILERSMYYRLRLCFVCREYKQNELTNCPGCPVASFCKLHPKSEIHDSYCAVMRRYLNLIKEAQDLNIDLQFLPLCFPFIRKGTKTEIKDVLTFSVNGKNSEKDIFDSKLTKLNLCEFINVASKFHRGLQKIYDIVPSEIVIYIDALHSKHPIVKENYWEFILHLNPGIKMLKIVVIGGEEIKRKQSETFLCKKCRSMKKNLIVEVNLMPYEVYVEQKSYRKPDVIFCRIDDRNCERPNRWSQIGCPVVLMFDSKVTFNKTINILNLFSDAYEIIHQGQISTYFTNSDDSLIGNEENFVIFKARENFCMKLPKRENNEEKNLKFVESSTSTFHDLEIEDSNSENLKKSEEKCSELEENSFYVKHNSFLKNENSRLREHLNASMDEIEKLQNKIANLQDICFKLVQKNKLIKDTASDIEGDFNLMLQEKFFKI